MKFSLEKRGADPWIVNAGDAWSEILTDYIIHDKEVNLKNPTSISGGGRSGIRPPESIPVRGIFLPDLACA